MPARHGRLHAHRGPAFESRQGTKSRDVEHPVQQALWGFGERRWCSACVLRGALWGEPIVNEQPRPGEARLNTVLATDVVSGCVWMTADR